jgi:RNA polymerase sigma-70 factor (ECF subfamily)
MLEHVFREQWGRVLAYLVGYLRDFDAAEEAAQEAFAIAAERWSRDGAPDNPAGWLLTTARNRAIDRLRRERTLSEKTRLQRGAEPPEEEIDMTAIPDERLELLFTCCHPALATDAQVALTLYAVGGLDTAAIARSFIVSPETMKRRLTRAKAKIKAAGIPFAVPDETVLQDRLAAVLAVIYLIFNHGYAGRAELASDAIRLGRVLVELMPDEPEVRGLLGLMLLHDARRRARFEGEDLVLLADQDRSLWDSGQIAEARVLVDRALAAGRGPYALQAAVASLQIEDPVDWAQIETLYRELVQLTGSPIFELNRAVAVAESHQPATALAIVDRLDLDGYQYLHSTRAELLRRLGRGDEARDAYERALALATAEAERRFLLRQRAEASPS